MRKERTISCEYVYADIDYRPLANLLAERFLSQKGLAKKEEHTEDSGFKNENVKNSLKNCNR